MIKKVSRIWDTAIWQPYPGQRLGKMNKCRSKNNSGTFCECIRCTCEPIV